MRSWRSASGAAPPARGAGAASLTLAAVIAAGFAVAIAGLVAPSTAAAEPSFSARVRAAEALAARHLAATERAARARRFAYYTVGNAWKYTGPSGWAAGYVPGGLWSCYQVTGRPWWRDKAIARQAPIGAIAVTPASLNVGALYFPTYARAFKLTGDARYRRKALRAADGVAARYDPEVGAMLSRPTGDFNVIIDSLMKPQLLWWAAANGGPAALADKARAHALTTARDFVRPDGSTYHIVFYDAETGAVLRRGQASGYDDESTWARGQAWAILGFAAAYRETGDAALLDAARAVADWYLANLPDDLVPYWDFGDPAIPDAPRDSSAAAIAASGLVDLALVDPDPERRIAYEAAARAILESLMSPAYTSRRGDPSVLLHGTYLRSAGITDRGLAFGDTFYLEALLRLRRLAPEAAPLPVAGARASSGNAAAAVDGELRTRWASRGRQTLDVRLKRAQQVGAVRVALYRGRDRAAVLRILVSADGRHWRLARRTMTSGEAGGYETLTFAPRDARWVRIECSGTTRDPVNRISEVEVYPAL